MDKERIPEQVKQEIIRIKNMKNYSEKYTLWELQQFCFKQLSGYISYAQTFKHITLDDYQELWLLIKEATEDCLKKSI